MNVEQIRIDTIGCHDKIFLNSAGSSLMPKAVVETVTEYIRQEEMLGGYEVARNRADQINAFYAEIGKLINCDARNIAFMFSATDAYSRALSAIPFAAGDSIVTSNDDYISNHIAFISLKKRYGIKIFRSENLANGDIDLDSFENLVKTHQPKLVALTHIPTNSGLIQDAEKVGEICSKYNIWYLLDACQSIGQMVVDVQKIKCDFLSATGRKFLRGPRGSGFLFISDKVIKEKLEPLFIDMRGATWTSAETYEVQMSGKRFEEWEFSYASLVGLTEAVKKANAIGMDKIQAYNQILANTLRNNLNNIKGCKVLDKGSQLSSIVTFHVDGIELDNLCEYLKKNEVRHSVTYKEHAIIDLTNKGVDWVIRFSPHYFNTLEEIESATNILRKLFIH
jgi:cysteine desulfurase / selenocysteine lyase